MHTSPIEAKTGSCKILGSSHNDVSRHALVDSLHDYETRLDGSLLIKTGIIGQLEHAGMLHTTQIADDMLLYDVIESRTRLIYFSYGVCFHDISIL